MQYFIVMCTFFLLCFCWHRAFAEECSAVSKQTEQQTLFQVDSNVLKNSFQLTNLKFELKEVVPHHKEGDLKDNVYYPKTSEEQDLLRVYVYKGLLFDSDGNKIHYPNKLMNYAMDETGALYFLNPKVRNATPRLYYHSSLTGGRPVAAVGNFRVENGKIVFADNTSGHYKPEPIFLAQFRRRTQELAMDVSQCNWVEFLGRPIPD